MDLKSLKPGKPVVSGITEALMLYWALDWRAEVCEVPEPGGAIGLLLRRRTEATDGLTETTTTTRCPPLPCLGAFSPSPVVEFPLLLVTGGGMAVCSKENKCHLSKKICVDHVYNPGVVN
ncbi:hypothetical protein ABZP36_011787 [Zizania latifolia]